MTQTVFETAIVSLTDPSRATDGFYYESFYGYVSFGAIGATGTVFVYASAADREAGLPVLMAPLDSVTGVLAAKAPPTDSIDPATKWRLCYNATLAVPARPAQVGLYEETDEPADVLPMVAEASTADAAE